MCVCVCVEGVCVEGVWSVWVCVGVGVEGVWVGGVCVGVWVCVWRVGECPQLNIHVIDVRINAIQVL